MSLKIPIPFIPNKRGGPKLAWVGFSSPGHFRLADRQLPCKGQLRLNSFRDHLNFLATLLQLNNVQFIKQLKQFKKYNLYMPYH